MHCAVCGCPRALALGHAYELRVCVYARAQLDDAFMHCAVCGCPRAHARTRARRHACEVCVCLCVRVCVCVCMYECAGVVPIELTPRVHNVHLGSSGVLHKILLRQHTNGQDRSQGQGQGQGSGIRDQGSGSGIK